MRISKAMRGWIRMKKVRRCCTNCTHFGLDESACYGGGYSEIGDPYRRLSEKDCYGFVPLVERDENQKILSAF